MIRSVALIIGLCVALTPVLARAQTNLDAGKSAAQIFANDCVECHKAPQGLAKGKSVSAVADFLREHYTTNYQQAAALAAYVLGGRGGEPAGGAAQGRGQKPSAARASASTEEPKPPKRLPTQAAKPGDGKPANARLRRPAPEEATPKEQADQGEQPSIAVPESSPHENRSPTASRNRRNEPKLPEPPASDAVAHAPAAAVPAPPDTTSSQDAGPSPSAAAAPPGPAAPPTDAASGDSGEGAPVPRDNIPD